MGGSVLSERGSTRALRVKQTLGVVLLTLLLFVIAEGLAGTATALLKLGRQGPPLETTRYDPDLGWNAIPNAHVPDMYGPGKYVKTNSRGFRNDSETADASADGRLRIVCSGNSFTYGLGVANDRVWCHLLSVLDDRFDPVNLALPGYGVDQMFLRYEREGAALQHAIHLFAFSAGDLNRMGSLDQHLYGKPVLILQDGELVVRNVPVPRLRWSLSRLVDRADLRSVSLGRRILSNLSGGKSPAPIVDRVGPVATRVFQRVHQRGEERGVVTIFVFLTNASNMARDETWRPWVRETMKRLGLPLIDLTPDMRAVPAGEVGTFFIPQNWIAGGHYTESGNDWVARRLHERLPEQPGIAELLTADYQGDDQRVPSPGP